MEHTKAPWNAVNYSGYWSIQKGFYYSDMDDLLDEEQSPNAEANAKLAAAAPEMLEALNHAKDILTKYELMNTLAGAYVKAAIKKATEC